MDYTVFLAGIARPKPTRKASFRSFEARVGGARTAGVQRARPQYGFYQCHDTMSGEAS